MTLLSVMLLFESLCMSYTHGCNLGSVRRQLVQIFF